MERLRRLLPLSLDQERFDRPCDWLRDRDDQRFSDDLRNVDTSFVFDLLRVRDRRDFFE